VTAGGRVLAVAAAAPDLREALGKVYGALAGIGFEGMQFRRDIGWRALKG
jgi:phosphoribosylamine--glycine ligase